MIKKGNVFMLEYGATYWQCQNDKCGVFFQSRFERCQACASDLKAVKRVSREEKDAFEEIKKS